MDDDDDFLTAVMEGVLDFPIHLHEMNNKIFTPFEINDSIDTPLTKMDQDIQFYSNSSYIQNTKCDYYLEDKFITKVAGNQQNKGLSFFHLNVKSLAKHFDELDLYINSLRLEFTFIALTETWLDDSKQDLYGMQNYTTVNRFITEKREAVYLYI